MKLSDIETGVSFTLEFKRLTPGTAPAGVGQLIPMGREYAFSGCPLELVKPAQRVDLDFAFSRNTAHLCEVLSSTKDGDCLLQISFFNGPLLDMGEITLAAPETIVAKKDRQTFPSKLMIEDPSGSGDGWFVMEASVPKEDESPEGRELFAFSIHGDGVRVDVEKLTTTDGSGVQYFSVRRIAPRRNFTPQYNYRLARGRIDGLQSEASVVSRQCEYALKKIESIPGKYLDVWKLYTNGKGERLLAKVRSFGARKITHVEPGPGKLYFEEAVPRQFIGSQIDIYENEQNLPPLSDLTQTWAGWLDQIRNAQTGRKDKKDTADKPLLAGCRIESIQGNYITLADGKNIDLSEIKKGFWAYISITGEKVQFERQDNARRSVEEGKCGIPHLGLLLEEGAELPQTQHPAKGKKLSALVYEKVFESPPTQNQRDAIDIALQTPDIALIQGPPGTGKTTVITAILEQLNAMHDKNQCAQGRVLTTSYQHAAVENVIKKLMLNAVPTTKFGENKREGAYTDNVDTWKDGVRDRLLEENPGIERQRVDALVETLLADYEFSSDTGRALSLLNELETLSSDPVISTRIVRAKEKIKKERNLDSMDPVLLSRIRALRVEPVSFSDDGRERACDIRLMLEDSLSDDEKDLLDRAADSGKDFSDFTALRALKRGLLREYSRASIQLPKRADREIRELAQDILDALANNDSTKNRVERILGDWFFDLENNPEGVKQAIRECDFVYASTIQQSEGREINDQKKSLNDDRWFVYDTVIVDEAARAAPPDLLIAMCKAAKRIILVGDHRQLPQLVEEDILKELDSGEGSEREELQRDYWKKSMFEHLFKRLSELEKKDGIRRRITLDTQYRTNPVLGDFASEWFYRRPSLKEGGAVEGYHSGKPASAFKHELAETDGKPAVWIDVPQGEGPEERAGTSFCREAEAKKIADYLQKWMKPGEQKEPDEKDKPLTFGVISFYKAQAELIEKILKDKSLDMNRIKVGTVDAFQGMDFDVVFLSMVRTNKDNRYGHLVMPNRLCVSMSRQKKLLAVVGDLKFATTPSAREEDAIPALAAFADLCGDREKGVILKKESSCE